MADSLWKLFAAQDDLITRRQALRFITEEELRALLRSTWAIVLPGVYLRGSGPLSPRQRLRAGLLHAGAAAQLTDSTGLTAYRVPFVPADDQVRLLVPDTVQRKSRDFVQIMRTIRPPVPFDVDGLPVAPPYRAAADFVRRYADERDSFAVIAATVQSGLVQLDQLRDETYAGPARGRPRMVRALAKLIAGVRSAPEADFRDLVLCCRRLPEPLWNCLVELPNGVKISPDALWVSAGLVHEVNSRRYHSWELAGEDAFEDMHRRSAVMVAAGLTVMGNTPRRITVEGAHVIDEVATTYQRENGKGLPPGVKILRYGPPGTPYAVDRRPAM
jgi:hypothetical protein